MKKFLLKNTICLSLIFISNSFTTEEKSEVKKEEIKQAEVIPTKETKAELIKRIFWSNKLRKGLTLTGSISALALAVYFILSNNDKDSEEVTENEE